MNNNDINVTIENMYEFRRALIRYAEALDGIDAKLSSLTNNLSQDMRNCSRYLDICREITQVKSKLREDGNDIDVLRRDLENRLDCIEGFDNGALGSRYTRYDEI